MKQQGKLYVVGIGPGAPDKMTMEAVAAIKSSQVLAGYTVYIDLMKDYIVGKEVIATPMKKEKERCIMALERASQGFVVSMVCSGDSGVYGMSGLILELAEAYPLVEIEIVAGVTAACSGAAVLGAPLCHDFAVISLSDLLTPMERIEKRLSCAAAGDFVICLYNPSSQKRSGYLRHACELILQHQRPDTVCAVVRNIGRTGEEALILTLEELKDTAVDMFTTVYIGNSQTLEIQGKMVTPRGYVHE